MDKNGYTPDETCMFKLNIDCGNSDLDIEKIVVSLEKHITLSNNQNHSKTFPVTVLSTDLDGCSSKETAEK